MAIRIRPAGELAQKFKTRAGAASGDYKSGVEQAGAEWEQNAANAKDAYRDGVTEALGKGRFERGIHKSGAAHYTKRASELGSARYAGGVAAGADRWAQNTQPFLQALASMTLPPRGQRGSPQNALRANFVAQELGKLRDAQ